MIVDEESPDSGELKVGETVAPMYVDQSREELNADETVFECISEGVDFVDLGGRDPAAEALKFARSRCVDR